MEMDVRVIERAGKLLKSDARSDPLRSKNCGRIYCIACSTGNSGGCITNSEGYKIGCQRCLMAGVSAVYDGKAGKNGFTRGLEHEGGVRIELIYSDEKQTFSMAVTENFHSCLEHIFNESVGITSSKANSVVNSK